MTTIIVVCLLLALSGCSTTYRAEVYDTRQVPIWPFYRGDLASHGAKDGDFSGKLDILWEHSSNDKPDGPLTIYHKRLVYPGARNKIKFLNLSSGESEGYVKPKGSPATGVVMKDSLAFFAVGPDKNKLRCINVVLRRIVWEQPVKDAVGGSIIVKDLVIVGSTEGSLSAFDLLTGELKWRFQARSRFHAPVTFGAGRLFQPGDDGTLYALSPEDGAELFSVKLDRSLVSAVVVDELVYLIDIDGDIYGIDPADGRIVWRSRIGGPVWTSFAVAHGRLYAGHSGGAFFAIDARDGTVVWRFDAIEVVRSPAIVVGEYVVFGTMAGKLFSLDAKTGALVEERQLTGAIVQAPVTDGSRIYVATEKGHIVCLGEKNELRNSAD